MKNRNLHYINLTRVIFAFLLFTFGNTWGQIVIERQNGTMVADRPIHYCMGSIFKASMDSDKLSFDDYSLRTTTTTITTGSTNIPFKSTNANIFSEPISIGFPFPFYGKTYTKVSVGRNGRLVFTDEDLSDENTYIDRTFSGMQGRAVSQLPSTNYNKIYKNDANRELPLAQIFAGYTDIIFNSSQASTTRYAYTQDYPFQGETGLLISMDGLVQTDGVGGRSSNQYSSHIILLKSGKIVLRVNNKRDQSYNAILGMQNENATKISTDIFAQNPQYNNGKWQSSNTTYIFSPRPKTVSSVKWYVNNVEKHIGQNYDYTPTTNTESLKAEITYTDNSTQTSEEVIFKILEKPIIVLEKISDSLLCFELNRLDIANLTNKAFYAWYRDGVFVGEGDSFIATVSGNYQAYPNNCSTSASDSIPITISNMVKNISLQTKLCSNINKYTIQNFKTDFPQYNDWNIVFSTDNVHFNLTEVNTNQPVYAKITSTRETNKCIIMVNLTFDFYEEIKVNPITPFPEHCFSSTEYFDLNKTKQELEYDDVKASFYFNYQNGIFSDEVPNLHYRGSGTIYVKLENSKGCVYQGTPPTLHLTIYRKPELEKTTPEQKKSACGSRVFDLTTDIRNYIQNWTKHAEIRYYDANHRQLSQSEWENYNPDTSGQPYMVFVYNSTNNLQCSDTIKFDLQYLTKPTSPITSIGICGETTYPLAKFKAEVLPSGNYILLNENQLEINADIPTNIPFKFYIKNNESGCLSDIQEVNFTQLNPLPLKTNKVDFVQCDTDFDGITNFNLDSKKSEFTEDTSVQIEYFSDSARTQVVSSNYQNTNNLEVVYVKISQQGFCSVNAEIHIKVNKPTKSSILQNKYFICYGERLSIDAGSENVNFQWSDGQVGQTATFTKIGKYSVTLTNSDNCSYTHHFEISDENQPKIKQINSDDTQIEVITEDGISPYQYSFDGGTTWQNSPIFTNPTQSQYTIQVKSANGCLGEPKSIYNIKIYNLITPNDDGVNDIWRVSNLEQMEQIEITIVDRYGKVVFQSTDKNKTEWNGKINGRPLPTGTYWYVVKWNDPSRNTNMARQGWILLKNRD